MSRAIFSPTPEPNHPADILDGAAAVTRFLAEVSPALHIEGGLGLSEKGAHGLHLILDGLEATIAAAAEKL